MGAVHARGARRLRMVVGLGNHWPYGSGRHSIGHRFLDAMAKRLRVRWSTDLGLLSRVAVCRKRGIVLLYPLLPYNINGWSVSRACRRFATQPEEQLTVVHDDLDKREMTYSYKKGGSALGNNGVKSVIAELNTQSFRRLRIGIGRPTDAKGSPVRNSAAITKYVLQAMTQQELEAYTATVINPCVEEMLAEFEVDVDTPRDTN